MTCGIYAIVNSTNDKVYIGQARDIERRWKEHKRHLKKNLHLNKHLQNDYYKYGKENFEYIILHQCNEDDLNYYEMKYILLYESTNIKKGYNKTCGGSGLKLSSNKLYVYNMLNNEFKIYNCKKYLVQEFYEKGYTKAFTTGNNYLNINCKDTKVNTKIPFHEYVIFSTEEFLNEYLKENNLMQEVS